MALFGKKREKKDEAQESVKTEAPKQERPAAPQKPAIGRDLSSVILRPRITEKAVRMTEQNIYTFEVRPDASKYDIRDAVREIFGVTPKRVNIVKNKTRSRMSRLRGRTVTERGITKAYVYLKEGDRIDLV